MVLHNSYCGWLNSEEGTFFIVFLFHRLVFTEWQQSFEHSMMEWWILVGLLPEKSSQTDSISSDNKGNCRWYKDETIESHEFEFGGSESVLRSEWLIQKSAQDTQTLTWNPKLQIWVVSFYFSWKITYFLPFPDVNLIIWQSCTARCPTHALELLCN